MHSLNLYFWSCKSLVSSQWRVIKNRKIPLTENRKLWVWHMWVHTSFNITKCDVHRALLLAYTRQQSLSLAELTSSLPSNTVSSLFKASTGLRAVSLRVGGSCVRRILSCSVVRTLMKGNAMDQQSPETHSLFVVMQQLAARLHA